MQTFSALLNSLNFSSPSGNSIKSINDITTSSQNSLLHPFEHLTKIYGEVVTYQGNIYVPGFAGNDFQLVSNGKKHSLRKMGSVDSQIKVPPSKTTFSTLKGICDQAIYYYNNPSRTETDLLRFADSSYRRQFFVDFFSQPLYFNSENICGVGTLNPTTVAIFKSKKKTIAFENLRDLPSTIDDVMSTSPGSKNTLSKFGDINRLSHYSILPGNLIDTVRFGAAIPRHSIRAIGHKFNFEGAILDFQCYFSKNAVQLKDYPRIANSNYTHFFVHVDGEICYDGEDRFIDIGLRRGKWYSLSDKMLGYKMARVLEQGLLNLTKGYTKTCRPVNKPETLMELTC